MSNSYGTYDLILRIFCYVSVLLGAYNVYYQFHRPRDISNVMERARKVNHMIVLYPQTEMRADLFHGIETNSWGVFTATDRGTIAVFRHSGVALYELCIPVAFSQFSVNDEAISVTSSSGETITYPFSNTTGFCEYNPLRIPAKENNPVSALQMSYGKIYGTNSNGKKIRFRYFGRFPKFFYDRVNIFCAVFMLIMFILLRIRHGL